jgi:hypothetical protein
VRRARLVALLALTALMAGCGGGDGVRPSGDSGNGGASAPDDGPDLGPDGRPLSPFTGLAIDEDVLERPLLIVKIENSPPARPQSGLDAADIVIEEVVEGGITRFFVIFHSELPAVAGPVRSARPVDTQLLKGFGPSGFAFSGARPEVQDLLATTPSVRISEGSAGFFRDAARNAPHNLYLAPGDALPTLLGRGATPLTTIGWTFVDAAPADDEVCPGGVTGCAGSGTTISIPLSAAFASGWDYDAAAGVYRRNQNGRPFDVTGDGRIGAANVVVLATRHYTGPTGYPETDVVTTGADAVVLRDGRRYAARWSKASESSLLVLETLDGRPFPLKPGATWVHLPPASALPALLP